MSDEKKPESLEGHKQKKKKELDGRIPIPELYVAMATIINGNIYRLKVPDFPLRFGLVEPTIGVKHAVIVNKDKTLTPVNDDVVAGTLMNYCHYDLKGIPDYCWGPRQITDAVKTWRYLTPSLQDVGAVRWLDDDGYCWHRLPWKYQLDDTPLFDEMLSRFSNRLALMCWIGSLFEPRSDRQQYVWIHGKGQDGKSALARFLARVFGQSSRSKGAPQPGDRFWFESLVNARFVVFPDCNSKAFVASGAFKQLTGDDPIEVNPKGKPSYTTYLQCKIMVLSNEKPLISSEKADMRRIIYSEAEPIPGEPDPGYEDALWTEGGAFLSACIALYRQECPRFGQIKNDKTDVLDLVSRNEEEFEVFFERYFVLEPSRGVKPADMQHLLRGMWKDNNTHGRFFDWLERTHAIRKKCARVDGQISKLYKGIGLRSSPVAEANLRL